MEKKRLERGLIHIYTGNGKGKTTAALGQGLRTAGGGYKVLMLQFLKGDDTGEIHSIERLAPNFELKRFGAMNKFYFQLNDRERLEVENNIKEALQFIKTQLDEENYNLIILDEIMAVLYNNIIDVKEIVSILENKPKDVEIILTGRNAPEVLIEIADYVTEMTMIKHPFERGINARKGIES